MADASCKDSGPVYLHRSQRFDVVRMPGGLVLKRATEGEGRGEALDGLRNEARVLERLRGIGECPRLVGFDPAAGTLALEDFGGVALDRAGLLGRVDLDGFLDLAGQLAGGLAAMHGRGVIHKDLNPANILVRPGERRLQIIDFDCATTIAEERPDFGQLNRILGTPAYLSPEQTGRMNRPVDYRTDFYSLGATLYALATGAPPFDTGDTVALVHAHLARLPAPPAALAPWLPAPLSELILTLLAKEPDQRYQSAAGLARDLAELREAAAGRRTLGGIRLKQNDPPLAPRPPRRLYGREAQLAQLLDAFKEGARAVFVRGHAGTGKTSLIQELHRPTTLRNGLFVGGKFDQLQRDRPLHGPSQCVRQLCDLLLAQNEAGAGFWRRRIADGLGRDAGALCEALPALGGLLGPLPRPPALGPVESQNRLRSLLVQLLRLAASPARPLVLFLDDLQWADLPSLDFIDALLREPALEGLTLVGAYRDDEIDAAHPLARLLGRPAPLDRQASTIRLFSLSRADTALMLADMLRLPGEAVRPLAGAVYEKTGGNPYFTREFLGNLLREGLLWRDAQGGWRWDLAAVAGQPACGNVVGFLSRQFAALAPETARLLCAAACLGNEFTLGMLALAGACRPDEAAERLGPTLELGLLVTPSALGVQRADPGATLRFCHDRMQQAVYEWRGEAERAALHLELARRFAGAGEALAAAQHYAAASLLLEDPSERAMAGRLFLLAAKQARRAGSFAAAGRFARLGCDLLAADAWQSNPDEAFALHAEAHLALCSQARHAEADAVYALLAARVSDPARLAGPAGAQIVSLTGRTLYREAIDLGCALLGRLGMEVPRADPLPSAEHELDLFYRHVEEGGLERMPSSPTIRDGRLLAAAGLMNRLAPVAYFSHVELAFWLVLRLARLWAEHGYCPALVSMAGALVIATNALRGEFAAAYRAGCALLAAGTEREQGQETARGWHLFNITCRHWFEPMEEVLKHSRLNFNELLRTGDLEFACYTFYTSQTALLEAGDSLAPLEAESEAAAAFAAKTGNYHALQVFHSFRGAALALKESPSQTGRFDAGGFDEEAHREAIAANPQAQCYYHILRAFTACLFGDAPGLELHAERGRQLAPGLSAFYPVALANVLHSLSLAGRVRAAAEAERPALLERLEANQAWLAARAADMPANFGHLHDLVEAERLAALGQPWAALQGFEQAMRRAQAHRRPGHHALAAERAGRFCLEQGLDSAARPLLARARALYREWGAEAKADQMEAQFAFLGARQRGASAHGSYDAIDHEAVLRASQALASETSQDRLVASMVELLGQLTGATASLLLLLDGEGRWFLEGGTAGGASLGRRERGEAEAARLLPASVLRFGLNTRQAFVSDDAVIDARFAKDPYFAGLPFCSLLALPVPVRGRICAFLVLENRLVRSAFTEGRVETVAMLARQFAISIENAGLYRSLERKVAERTRALQEANRKLAALSATDGLTGIANRAKFEEVWKEEWQRALRQRKPLAVGLIDVDHFKAYNDRYGHQAGDECLRRVARALAGALQRAGDFVARYGGEEFVVIASATDEGQAGQAMERLRLAVEAMALPHEGNSAAGVVTISLGWALAVPRPGGPPGEFLEQADRHLYQAKREGRNRVCRRAATP